MRHRPRVFVLLILLVALFSIQPEASSHVRVVSTSPQENSTVEHLPARVVIEFNEPLIIIGEQNPNSLTLTSKSGASATSGLVQVSGSRLSIALNPTVTETGDFTVSYRAVSNDGHRVSGSFGFRLMSEEDEVMNPAPTKMSEEGENPWGSLPILGILGVLALLAIGGWGFHRARFAHWK